MPVSCSGKNHLVAKWNLIDEKISCTNPALDSIERSKIGIYKSGELINKEEAEKVVERGDYFIFSSNSKYIHQTGNFTAKGTYQLKDSFLLMSQTVLSYSIVSEGYKVHFIDDNNLQLIEEMTIKNRYHVHTYTLLLRKDPDNSKN